MLRVKSIWTLGLLALVLLGFMFILTPSASAADIRSGDTVVIPEDTVVDDDLIVSANVIEVNGTVTGDLLASGSRVIVNGIVEGSALLVGQSVEVGGDINGSLYVGSYALNLAPEANVGRNLYFGGYSLTTAAGSEVGRSAYVGGYQMLHEGSIGDDLLVGVTALELNGSVAGDVRGGTNAASDVIPPSVFIPQTMPVQVQTLQPGLRVGESADIGGEVAVQEYVPPVEVQPTVEERGFLGLPNWFTNRLGEFIGLLIVGAVVIYLSARFLPSVGDTLLGKPWPSLGWGLLISLVIFPLAMVVGLMLVILLTIVLGVITFGELVGPLLSLGLSGLAFLFFVYLFVAYMVTKLLVGYVVGRRLLSRTGMNPASRWTQFAYLALGLLIYEVLRAIPIFGWPLSLFIMFFGLGVLFVHYRDRRQAAVKTVPQPQPQPAMGD